MKAIGKLLLDSAKQNTLVSLHDFLTKNKKLFEYELIGDLSYLHHRAYSPEGIEIIEVTEIEDNKYQLNYQFGVNIFALCKDISSQTKLTGSTKIELDEKGEISLDILQTDKLSASEEF
ncbi:hypothetical protein [Paraferrimonas sp. SM1919]|uniref:hypothetical protein n=1 Tax=Paraferrimonas sp. SM1919 TaxID=2662263 RepID=UPI0013D8619E|nr:hypothetical protein [Paraferrimonas sp. SM1919]